MEDDEEEREDEEDEAEDEAELGFEFGAGMEMEELELDHLEVWISLRRVCIRATSFLTKDIIPSTCSSRLAMSLTICRISFLNFVTSVLNSSMVANIM